MKKIYSALLLYTRTLTRYLFNNPPDLPERYFLEHCSSPLKTSKRMCGLTIIVFLILLLTACSTAPSSKSQSQAQNFPPYFMQEKEYDILKKPIKSVTLSEENENNPNSSILEEELVFPEEYIINDFPIVFQMPELPTGCEITAITMVLNYYGYNVDKSTMASEYLPTVSNNQYYGADGRLYGNDLRKYFVGDPFTQAGYICGTEAILSAVNTYLQETKSSMQAINKSGAQPEELYELVSKNTPVMVWITIDMADRSSPQGWYTEDGDYVDWSTNDHGAVLIGYSTDMVMIADPLSGIVEYSRTQFESVFASRSYQCVILDE